MLIVITRILHMYARKEVFLIYFTTVFSLYLRIKEKYFESIFGILPTYVGRSNYDIDESDDHSRIRTYVIKWVSKLTTNIKLKNVIKMCTYVCR